MFQPVGTPGANFVCLFGSVTLFQFIQAPPPGSVIGTLTTLSGRSIPLVQTSPTTGGVTLASVDRQLAIVCGNLTAVQGQIALDVRFVSPGFPSGFGR